MGCTYNKAIQLTHLMKLIIFIYLGHFIYLRYLGGSENLTGLNDMKEIIVIFQDLKYLKDVGDLRYLMERGHLDDFRN